MPSLGLSLFWFVVILAAIPLSLWWVKRSPLGASLGAGARQPVRPVGSFAIGPGQRLVTVEVGEGEARTWLVLGVTGQRISKLHVMPAQVAPQADAAAGVPPAFAQAQKFAAVLQRLRQPAARGAGAPDEADPSSRPTRDPQ